MAPLLFLIRHSPRGSSAGEDAVDAILAAAALDVPVEVLFMGAGVLQLLENQQVGPGVRDLAANWQALPVFDVESCYVEASALHDHGLDTAALTLPVSVLNEQDLQDCLQRAGQVVSF